MQNNVEIIQINISGEDKPGMTSSLTEILARYDAFILDIGQANIHQSLTLGILFKTTSDKSGNIMKELLFKASELGVMIRFTPISEQNYDNWVGRQGKNRYIITLLGRTVTARHIAEVTRVVAQHGLNIDAIKRLTGRIPLSEDDRAAKSCIELSVRGSLTDEERSTMQEGFMNLSEIGLDVSFQKDDIYRRSRRLICFDADRDRGDRRTGRACRRGRCGARDHGARHAGRDRLPRKLHRARGPAQGARRLGHGGNSP